MKIAIAVIAVAAACLVFALSQPATADQPSWTSERIAGTNRAPVMLITDPDYGCQYIVAGNGGAVLRKGSC